METATLKERNPDLYFILRNQIPENLLQSFIDQDFLLDTSSLLLDLLRTDVDGVNRRCLCMALGLGVPEFSTWRTIDVGTKLRNAEDFCRALKASRCRISGEAESMFSNPKFTVATQKTKLKLVKISVLQLCLLCRRKWAGWDEICDRAHEFGLELCPPEVGPQLRLQYDDQSSGWLSVAMEPIFSSASNQLRIFFLGADNKEMWLSSRFHGEPQSKISFSYSDELVFWKRS